MPEGSLAVSTSSPDDTVLVLTKLGPAQKRDVAQALRKHIVGTNDPAFAPTRALDPHFPRYGEAVVKRVGKDGMLDSDDVVNKARGESATWRKDLVKASLRPGGANLT